MVKFLLGGLALVPWFLFVVNGSYLQGQIALFGGHHVAPVGTLKAALLLVLLSCALFWSVGQPQSPYSLSIVCHYEGARIGAKSRPHDKSLLANYYGLRSCLLFTRQFFAYASPTVYLRLLVMILKRIRRRQWKCTGMVLRPAFGMHGLGSESQLIARAQERRAKRC